MIVETRRFHHAWWGSGEPICVSAVPWDSDRSIGVVRNVRFINILCRSENGVYVEGWTLDRVQNVLFENVRVELSRWSKWPGARYDRRPCPGDWAADPEQGFLHHPTAGFFLSKARQVTLRSRQVVCHDFPDAEFGAPLQVVALEGLVLEGFALESLTREGPTPPPD